MRVNKWRGYGVPGAKMRTKGDDGYYVGRNRRERRREAAQEAAACGYNEPSNMDRLERRERRLLRYVGQRRQVQVAKRVCHPVAAYMGRWERRVGDVYWCREAEYVDQQLLAYAR